MKPEIYARILAPYREWIHSINQQAVEKTTKKMLYCLMTERTKWEMWVYEQGKKPELQP